MCQRKQGQDGLLGLPGGPYIRQPFGGFIPSVLNLSACSIGKTMASTSSSICFSRPPMSVYVSVGLSSTSIALTLESNSVGSLSRTRYESLFTPTRSEGLSSLAGTRPIKGRNTVCRVEVFTTAHFPLRIESRSLFAPSSSPSGSTSKICETPH